MTQDELPTLRGCGLNIKNICLIIGPPYVTLCYILVPGLEKCTTGLFTPIADTRILLPRRKGRMPLDSSCAATLIWRLLPIFKHASRHF